MIQLEIDSCASSSSSSSSSSSASGPMVGDLMLPTKVSKGFWSLIYLASTLGRAWDIPATWVENPERIAADFDV